MKGLLPRHKKGFTLIELLVVVSIISLLSTVVLASLNTARAKARDSLRIQSVKQLQNTVELYYQDNGSYPTTAGSWRGGRSGCFGGHGYGSTGYIPGVVPQYISVLPEDPTSSSAPVQCYIYRSDGIDYMIIAYRGAESFNAIGTVWERPNPSDTLRAKHITVYSSGAGTASPPW